ncbi:MAG: cytochrome c [Campylobacter sp.]|nr:cytochrome c [Campylobacter sp.]
MKKILLTALLCSVVFASGADVSDEEVEKNWNSYKDAYNKLCAYCHTYTNVGDQTVTIPYPEEVAEDRIAIIENVVRHGLNAMPPFRETEIDKVTLRELALALARGEFDEGGAQW